METPSPWINSLMPNRKTDTNNQKGFSTDFIGQNWIILKLVMKKEKEL